MARGSRYVGLRVACLRRTEIAATHWSTFRAAPSAPRKDETIASRTALCSENTQVGGLQSMHERESAKVS